MAGRLPSFASGSNLVIKMGKITLAYATNLSFSDDVSHASVGGIGSYSYDALEPLQYIARGSMSIVRYNSATVTALKALNSSTPQMPARANQINSDKTDGNSMLETTQFNPVNLLLSRSFDIEVYERTNTNSASSVSDLLFKLQDCRLTDYSITFNPGSLIVENVGFMCIRIIDSVSQK